MLNASKTDKFIDIERYIPYSTIDDMAIKLRSMSEIYLSLGVLAFGFCLIVFSGIISLKNNTIDITKIFTIFVVVTAGLFLITAGYSDIQISPVFGLLGAIVGYTLGK